MEAILMGAATVVAVCAGTFLAIVLGAPIIGITWDIIVHRAARARGASGAVRGLLADLRVAVDLAGTPVFQRESWYGRLILQAYGEDRGWVVALRRLFGRTGFVSPSPPTFPQHECAQGACEVCVAHGAERDAYHKAHAAAYAQHLAELRRPPHRKPFFQDAPDGNVCPTFWSVILAAWVYVPLVYVPTIAAASVVFIVLGIAHGVAAGFRMLVRRFGRPIATTFVMAAWGLSVYFCASMVNWGMHFAWNGYTAWQVQHVAEQEAAVSEHLAAPEFSAHAVERALLEEQYETTVTLAGLWFLDHQRDEWRTELQRKCDGLVQTFAEHPSGITPAAWQVKQLRECGASGVQFASFWIAVGRDGCDYWGRRDGVFARWWQHARNGYWNYVSNTGPFLTALSRAEEIGLMGDREDRAAVLDRVIAEVEDLTAGDDVVQQAVLAPYRIAALRAQAVLDAQLFRKFLALTAAARRANPGDIAWLTSECREGVRAWESYSGVSDYYPDNRYEWRYDNLSQQACVPSYGGAVTCGVTDGVCTLAAQAFSKNVAAWRAARDAMASMVQQQQARDDQRTREQQEAFHADLEGLRGEPVALLAILERSCYPVSFFNGTEEVESWRANRNSGLFDRTCSDAGIAFQDEIATAQRYQWLQQKYAAVAGWWGTYFPLMSLIVSVLLVLGLIVASLTFLVLKFGIADLLAHIATAFWMSPPVVLVREATWSVAVMFGRVIGAIAMGVFWLIKQPFRPVGILMLAIGRGLRDAVIFIAAFVKGWYEKRCYQITWQ